MKMNKFIKTLKWSVVIIIAIPVLAITGIIHCLNKLRKVDNENT